MVPEIWKNAGIVVTSLPGPIKASIVLIVLEWGTPISCRFTKSSRQRGTAVFFCESFQSHLGVSKNRGCLPPKMDGEYNGKPYFLMDDVGGFPLFLETPT